MRRTIQGVIKKRVAKGLTVLVAAMIAHVAVAQNRPARPVAALPDDVLAIKQKAEAGNVQAQVVLAEKLAAIQRPADALTWYLKAAEQAHIEAYYRIGDMLLHGSPARNGQNVPADPAAGMQWTYRAATNLHAKACQNMSRALQSGLGAKTNLVEAYAWLQLFAEHDPVVGRAELERLALRLDTAVLLEAQNVVKQFKNQQWPKFVTNRASEEFGEFKLEGVNMGGRSPLVVVNRRTLAVGETAQVPVNGKLVEVKCLAIEAESVLIEVVGEDEPRLLRFDQGFAVSGGK